MVPFGRVHLNIYSINASTDLKSSLLDTLVWEKFKIVKLASGKEGRVCGSFLDFYTIVHSYQMNELVQLGFV